MLRRGIMDQQQHTWNTLEYRLHARVGILHGTKPAVCLWYALRALDVDGTGKVTMPVGEAERQLGKSASTIRRYLMDGMFFRSYTVADGVITIYLHGLASVCRALHLTDIGPVGFTEGLDTIQKDAALIGAQSLQQSSQHLAIKALRGKQPNLVDASTIQADSSFITGGVTEAFMDHAPQCLGNLTINTVSGRPQKVHLLHEAATLYGASIEGIAGLLQVCSKTIARALKGVLRIRQAQQIPEWEYQALKVEASQTLRGTNDDSPYPFYSRHVFYGPYRLYTYLYYPLHVLCSQKNLKSHINPSLKAYGL